VLNGEDAGVLTLARGAPGRHRHFRLDQRADAWLDKAGEWLMLGERRLLARRDLPLLGPHNVANALAAALAVDAAGVPLDVIAGGLATARGLAHRMEVVREVRGVLWINDSKGTNVASTLVALRAMDRPFVLIAGGRAKGEGFSPLAALLRGRCRAAIAYGEARTLLAGDLDGACPVEEQSAFDAAVARAAGLARPGEAVLLSPACASFDQFANYEERGARFRHLVEAM
jgi:UDP-N-acetylmuramoylalanine--D-glutamate ligase